MVDACKSSPDFAGLTLAISAAVAPTALQSPAWMALSKSFFVAAEVSSTLLPSSSPVAGLSTGTNIGFELPRRPPTRWLTFDAFPMDESVWAAVAACCISESDITEPVVKDEVSSDESPSSLLQSEDPASDDDE